MTPERLPALTDDDDAAELAEWVRGGLHLPLRQSLRLLADLRTARAMLADALTEAHRARDECAVLRGRVKLLESVSSAAHDYLDESTCSCCHDGEEHINALYLTGERLANALEDAALGGEVRP